MHKSFDENVVFAKRREAQTVTNLTPGGCQNVTSKVVAVWGGAFQNKKKINWRRKKIF
jgi:predicted SpoU family rRNA methylase